jgi:hypothetical protein
VAAGRRAPNKSVSWARARGLASSLVDIRALDDAALADDAVMRAYWELNQRAELFGREHAPFWSFEEFLGAFRSTDSGERQELFAAYDGDRMVGNAVLWSAPDGFCRCAGTLHASVKIPAARMFGRNSTLTVARSHIRTVIPAVLDLVAAGRIRPELVTTTIASFEDAPKVLSDHLRSAATKAILVRTR